MRDRVELLREVDFLRGLEDPALAELAGKATLRRFRKGSRVVSELEPGADVFVIASGEAEVTIDGGTNDGQVVGTLREGDAFGEMSSLTGEVRSATVTAKSDLVALVIADADFDRLREDRPIVARHLVRILGRRLAAAETALDDLLTNGSRDTLRLATRATGGKRRRSSVLALWHELVVNRKRDLPFLALVSFALTLVVVRGLAHIAFRFDPDPRALLRALYVAGFALLGISSCASLLTFRPRMRQAIALGYGIGLALIANQLGITLAFDIFYKDIHTPDPNVPFDIETLYRRTEAPRAIAVGFLVLFQLAYLRRFYSRLAFMARARMLRIVFGRSRSTSA